MDYQVDKYSKKTINLHAKKTSSIAGKSTVKNNSPILGRKKYQSINFKEVCDKLNIHLITDGIDML